jgi:hypothetical protein
MRKRWIVLTVVAVALAVGFALRPPDLTPAEPTAAAPGARPATAQSPAAQSASLSASAVLASDYISFQVAVASNTESISD